MIRTVGIGRATFTRGNETVEVGTNTQIQIFDTGAKEPFTTVKQYFGSVSVEAEVEQVQHFAVQTPYLAAVVKGTRFTVTSGETGASVSVRRGHVAVEDILDHTQVLLSVGQSASVDRVTTGSAMVVSGEAAEPQVLTVSGVPVADTGSSSEDKSNNGKSSKDKSDKSNNGNSGNANGNSGGGNSGKGSDDSDSGGSGKVKKDKG